MLEFEQVIVELGQNPVIAPVAYNAFGKNKLFVTQAFGQDVLDARKATVGLGAV